MPLGGEAMGAAIGGFFGEDKLKPVYYSEPLAGYYNRELITGLRDLTKAGKGAAKDYAAAIKSVKPQAQAITQENIGRLGDLVSEYAAYDPLANYERIRAGNISSLADQFANLATQGQRAQKLALASRGYGGRGPSTYENILTADRISRNIAPVLNTIYGTLGPDAASAERSRLANLAAQMQLMNTRAGLPIQQAYLDLLPYAAQAEILSPQVSLANQVGEGVKANTAGQRLIPNKWRNFFTQSGRAFDQVGDFAMDAAQLYFGGGLAGGLGGLLGGAGGGTVASQVAQAAPPQLVSGGIRSLGSAGYPAVDYTPPSYFPGAGSTQPQFWA